MPRGFAIDSFEPAPRLEAQVQSTGSGEEAVVQKVTWTGGTVPTGRGRRLPLQRRARRGSKTYTFDVRQTYSDGSVVDWNGPGASDNPAPTVEAIGSFGGGGSSTLAIVALVVGALGLLVGVLALVGREAAAGVSCRGRRRVALVAAVVAALAAPAAAWAHAALLRTSPVGERHRRTRRPRRSR